MANNFTITQGTGTTIKATDNAGVLTQHVNVDTAPTTAVTNAGITSIDGKITACDTTDLATSAKQPALGTAGTASADVISVQGIASMTPLLATVSQGTAASLKCEATIAAAQTVAVTNAGTFAVQAAQATAGNLNCTEASASAIKTAVEVIDNCISGSEAQVDIVAALPAGTNIIGAVKRDTINYTPIRKYYANTGAATDGIVWSPAAGKKWVVTDITFTTSAAATVTFEEDKTGGDEIVHAGDYAANGGIMGNLQTPWFGTEDDADLVVTTSAGNIKVTVSGYEID